VSAARARAHRADRHARSGVGRPIRRRLATATAAGLVAGCAVAAVAIVMPDPSRPPSAVRAAGAPEAASTVPGTAATGTPAAVLPAIPEPAVRACVARALERLSRQDRAGQVVMAGVSVDDPASAAPTVRRQRLGGVFLAGRSDASPTAVRRAVDKLRAAVGGDIPLYVAVDQEGGNVQTLNGSGFTDIPPAVEQGGWKPARLAERTRRWARPLAQAGVTLDLAPVADTVPPGTATSNPPIGGFGRQYGESAAAVAADVAVVVRALQESRVQATVKHFPGLGRVRTNTDSGSDAVDRVATADDPYLAPFREAIDAGVSAVMVSSARYPRLDDRSVAVFSRPIVTDLLRERLRFGGLVVSDDLGAAEAVRAVPVGERAVRFVAAGGDLVLTVRLHDAATMTHALGEEARRSPAFARRLGEAAGSVLESKARGGLLPCAGAAATELEGH
jgi:beta-N-acetylhexosaminidase